MYKLLLKLLLPNTSYKDNERGGRDGKEEIDLEEAGRGKDVDERMGMYKRMKDDKKKTMREKEVEGGGRD